MRTNIDIRGTTRSEHERGSGSAAVEFVLLTPVLVVLMLFIVFAGRSGEGMGELRHAADQGARAASQVARPKMAAAARRAVLDDLHLSGLSCTDPRIDLRTSSSAGSSSVTVTVTCLVSNEGLGILRLKERRIRAASTEIVDRFRSQT